MKQFIKFLSLMVIAFLFLTTSTAFAENVKGLSATDWFKKGINFYESGNYKEAINAYNKAIKLNPRLAAAYNNRGLAYSDLGNYQQAINDYSKAIQLNPQYAEAYYNRGIVYGKLGNGQKAIADMKIAAKLGNKEAQDYLKSQGIEW